MTTRKVDFTGVKWGSVEWTMLSTLYLRAYESRSERSILADHAAAEAVDRIHYDFERLEKYIKPATNQYLATLRAKQLDLWAAHFLARHPDAVVLHLGCGLDSRAFRLEAPPDVDWFDLDLPNVIELRRQIYPEHDHYRMIGSSVTDPAWLDAIPTGRPVLIIAEGLLMFIEPDEVRRLLLRFTDRFSAGELLFDALSPLMAKTMKLFHWGIRDGEIERWNPGLKYVEEASMMSHYRMIPTKGLRTVYRLSNAIPFARRINRQFRYEF